MEIKGAAAAAASLLTIGDNVRAGNIRVVIIIMRVSRFVAHLRPTGWTDSWSGDGIT